MSVAHMSHYIKEAFLLNRRLKTATALGFVAITLSHYCQSVNAKPIPAARTIAGCLKIVASESTLAGEATLWMRKWTDTSSALSPEGVDVFGYFDKGDLKTLKLYLYGENSQETLMCRVIAQKEIEIVYVHWRSINNQGDRLETSNIDCVRALRINRGKTDEDCVSGLLVEDKSENLRRVLEVLSLAAEKVGGHLNYQ